MSPDRGKCRWVYLRKASQKHQRAESHVVQDQGWSIWSANACKQHCWACARKLSGKQGQAEACIVQDKRGGAQSRGASGGHQAA